MIISAASDYRAAAQRILPPFLFHYIDGGAYAEYTLRRNVEDLSQVALRQRVLRDVSALDTSTELFGERQALPVVLVCKLGQTATDAAKRLRKAGFTNVSILEGGVQAWQGADLPVVKGKSR